LFCFHLIVPLDKVLSLEIKNKSYFILYFPRLFVPLQPDMCSLESLKIDLKAMKEGQNALQFSLSDDYFEAISASEVSRGDVHVALEIQRSVDIFTINMHVEGVVEVPCDLCLDDMEQPIASDRRFTVRFGDDESEDDDVLIVSEDEGVLDTSWMIYEQIVLAIPIKHVHAPGKCNAVMTRKLEELSAARSSDGGENQIDERWSALKQLKFSE
jgi:uncharacterized metal-binding protein YceD (DUF177 family)